MAKFMMDDKFIKSFKAFLEENMRIDVDKDDLKLFISAHYQHVGEFLGQNKSESEDVELELQDYITYKCSYREGTSGNGNFGIGITAGSEMKKRIKSDEMLEELGDNYSDDDIEDEE